MLVKRAQPADGNVGKKERQEGDAHHGRLDRGWRRARDERKQRRPIVEERDAKQHVVQNRKQHRHAHEKETGEDEQEVGRAGDRRPGRDLRNLARLAAAASLPFPQGDQHRHRKNAGERIDGIEPRYRHAPAE